MPYIKKKGRSSLKSHAETLGYRCESAGDLNYAITVLLHQWLQANGLDYANLNAVIGMLECVKQELYRRVAAPYEDTKIKQNGDIGILEE